MIEVCILDTGCGIPAENMRRYLSLFHDEIGRAWDWPVLSKAIIESHSGQIGDSHRQRRHDISFTLPTRVGQMKHEPTVFIIDDPAILKSMTMCWSRLASHRRLIRDARIFWISMIPPYRVPGGGCADARDSGLELQSTLLGGISMFP
jgi:hypothetical protein